MLGKPTNEQGLMSTTVKLFHSKKKIFLEAKMINWLPKYYKYFSKVLTSSLQKDLFLGNKRLIFILKQTKKKVKSFWEADTARSLIDILNAHIH